MSVKAVDVLDAGLKSQGLIVEQEKNLKLFVCPNWNRGWSSFRMY